MYPTMGQRADTARRQPHGAIMISLPGEPIAGKTHVCCECAFSHLLRVAARCTCSHPSGEFADGVLFSGAPACAAFVPRHVAASARVTEAGAGAILHGN